MQQRQLEAIYLSKFLEDTQISAGLRASGAPASNSLRRLHFICGIAMLRTSIETSQV